MIRIILTVSAATALLSLFPSTAFACECAVPWEKSQAQQVKLARKQALSVFVGEVAAIIDLQTVFDVKFKVRGIWKGPTAGEISVLTRHTDVACGIAFRVGESYLVYAWRLIPPDPDALELETSICSRTRRLAHADLDLKVLGRPNTPKPGQ
jgi:hypothetical protein